MLILGSNQLFDSSKKMMLEETLLKIHPVEKEILNEYLSHWNEVTFKRKEFLIVPEQIERYLYFTMEGVQKSYFLKEEKEYIIAFAHPGSFSGNPKSLYTQTPSDVFVECITPCKMIRIKYTTHLDLLEKYRPLETLFRKAGELLLVGVLDRYGELMSLTIEERFRSFCKRSPKLLNIIPHKDLASYLRIDASNFSKLINSIKV